MICTNASLRRTIVPALLVTICLFACKNSSAQAGWFAHAHDSQHSSVSAVSSQPLSTVHWHVPVDLAPPEGEIFIHYGSPLVTTVNTVIVPVKTGANSFRVEAHDGATGKRLWQEVTGYKAPTAGFIPGLGPALSGNNLYIPDVAGRILVRKNPDETKNSVAHLYFYGQKNFTADPTAYEQNVQINTPLTADASGNIYFGFLVLGPTPIGLQSGLARVTPSGVGTWVSATSIANDSAITRIAMSCAPALSPDGSTVYIAVDSGDFGFGYLIALNSSTLAVVNRARLLDPSSGMDAGLSDDSSSAPTVGPDGDVYFGVLENPFPNHNDRGWMLHFNSNLTKLKTPGSFGWDDTPSIVDSSLVASYHGKSKYLIMTKYNNYGGVGTGDGMNKVAILDPNATEKDPVISTVKVMKEVITKLGLTPDPNHPGGVREWCINTAAVDPITKAVMVNSEDGKLYRWDLTSNTLSEMITLSGGIGEAYTPTVIGSDGTVYAINDAVLDAVGK